MNGTQVRTEIREAIGKVLRRDPADIQDDTRLFEDLHFDSTSVLELLAEIEDRTGLAFDGDELDECMFRTVGTITDFVQTRLGLAART